MADATRCSDNYMGRLRREEERHRRDERRLGMAGRVRWDPILASRERAQWANEWMGQ